MTYLFVFSQVLEDRIESLTKQIQDVEGKNQSLQLTVDRLSLNLAKTESEECAQKVCTVTSSSILLVSTHYLNGIVLMHGSERVHAIYYQLYSISMSLCSSTVIDLII